MKPLNQLTEGERAAMESRPVQERCDAIIAEFDEWLAVRVVILRFKYAELPQLNDAFRDYFASTRTTHPTGGST